MVNLLIYLTIGIIVGAIIHLLDNAHDSLKRTMMASILGSVLAGVFAFNILDQTGVGVSISSILLVTSSALFVALLWKMIAHGTRGSHTKEYNDWRKESRAYNRYEYATFSDIRLNRTNQSQRQVNKLINKIEYPASKRDLIRFAEEHDVSEDTLSALEKIPDHIYDSADDLKERANLSQLF